MSHQVEALLTETDQAMRKLSDAVEAIPIRRDFFRLTHRALTKAMATLTVEIADHAGSFADDR